MTGKQIKEYIKSLGHEPRHDCDALSDAVNDMIKSVNDGTFNKKTTAKDLLQLQDDIRNVYAGGEQRRGHEMKSAQQAMIQSKNKPTGLRMGGASNAMLRKQMQDTLSQRLFATQENTASQYANLLSMLDSRVNTGFNIAGDILNMNPDAASQYRVGPDGELVSYGDEDGLTNYDTKRTTRRT